MNSVKFILIVFSISLLLVEIQSAPKPKTKFDKWEKCNDAVDMLIGLIRMGMREEESVIQISDFAAGAFKFIGVHMGDLRSLRRTGDAWRMQPEVDTMQVNGSYGIKNLEVNVDKLITELGEAGPVKITAVSNSVDIFYTMYNKSKRNCRTDWSKFKFTELTGIKVTSTNPDFPSEHFSELFEAELMDALNELTSNTYILKQISKYLDFCLRLF